MGLRAGSGENWVPFLPLLQTSCDILGKSDISLWLSFLIYKMGIIFPPSSQRCCEASWVKAGKVLRESPLGNAIAAPSVLLLFRQDILLEFVQINTGPQ